MIHIDSFEKGSFFIFSALHSLFNITITTFIYTQVVVAIVQSHRRIQMNKETLIKLAATISIVSIVILIVNLLIILKEVSQ